MKNLHLSELLEDFKISDALKTLWTLCGVNLVQTTQRSCVPYLKITCYLTEGKYEDCPN